MLVVPTTTYFNFHENMSNDDFQTQNLNSVTTRKSYKSKSNSQNKILSSSDKSGHLVDA
jgi:hypothetical protein